MKVSALAMGDGGAGEGLSGCSTGQAKVLLRKLFWSFLVQRRKSNPRVAYHGVVYLKLFWVMDPLRVDENEGLPHLSYLGIESGYNNFRLDYF